MTLILAVDYGSKNIGLALSDESGTIANPREVISHVSRIVDAASVAERAEAYSATHIIVGVSYDEEGRPNPAGRSALRFIEALKMQTPLAVENWDESLTTQDARAARISMNTSRKKRSGHMDNLAATVLLQSYLDSK